MEILSKTLQAFDSMFAKKEEPEEYVDVDFHEILLNNDKVIGIVLTEQANCTGVFFEKKDCIKVDAECKKITVRKSPYDKLRSWKF